MRMKLHTVKTPAWTQNEYGEPVATYSDAPNISMMIGWNSMSDQDANDSLYKQYEFVGLTRETVAVGSLIDGEYVVGHVEPGRWNRVFMKHAKGKERTYGQLSGNSSEDTQ